MTAVVTAVVRIRCDYCGERCGLSLRRCVIHRMPRRLPPPATRGRLLCEPGLPQLSRARGSSSGASVVGAALTSDDLATWAGQVEAEFARVNARLDEKLAEMSGTVPSSREVATACADQMANFDVVVRQFVENNSGLVATSRDNVDAQERQRRKAQLTTEMSTWDKINTARKLWIIRGRIPPNLGDSPADLQSFVGETIHVTMSPPRFGLSARLTSGLMGPAWTGRSGTHSWSPIASPS